MSRYAYNPGKAPHITGTQTFAPEAYSVVSEEFATIIKSGDIPISLEGDDDFEEIWVRNFPNKTPDQLLPR